MLTITQEDGFGNGFAGGYGYGGEGFGDGQWVGYGCGNASCRGMSLPRPGERCASSYYTAVTPFSNIAADSANHRRFTRWPATPLIQVLADGLMEQYGWGRRRATGHAWRLAKARHSAADG